VDETEDAVEKEFSQLMRLILARYHEEQVWSDKIRSASTYGQLAALGLNLLVFILAIILVEPWKRKRLAQTFERKVEELSEDYADLLSKSMKNIEEKLAGHEGLLVAVAEELAKRVADEQEPPPYSSVIAESGPPPALPAVSPQEEPTQDDGGVKRIYVPGRVQEIVIPERTLELAVVGTSMFVMGAIVSFMFNSR